MTEPSPRPTRRSLLAVGAALPLFGILARPAAAAEFNYKLATGQDPTHPVNTRAQEALDRIREATGGRLDIQLFPANQLGSDTDLLSQVRSGGVEFFNLSTSILATLVPAAGLPNTGFAFPDYDAVWRAMDGDLGGHVRGAITKAGLIPVCKAYDNGFRHITTSGRPVRTPDDLKGLKLRVPPAPALTTLFRALGAGPTPIDFSELYSALRTRVVEGQENPLAIIATARIYEVQKTCSMTGHVWDGYWVLGNRRAWERLPQDIRATVAAELDRSVGDQRADIARLSASLRQELTAKGIEFNDADRAAFRDALGRTDFYRDWKGKYGEEAWSILERSTGKLV